MDHIRKAIELAKGPSGPDSPFADHAAVPQSHFEGGLSASPPPIAKELSLNAAWLESQRIIAHDIADPRSRSFDMLRTQVLQTMDMRSWQFLGTTSATEGCGKSVVSTNLALSIARQPERSVLLVDMDLQKPQVASYLGLDCDRGILSVLQGRTRLHDSLVRTRIANHDMLVLPCEGGTLNSSGWIASRPMRALLDDIKREFRGWTVVFDLPPLLASDDVISLLPQLDCVLFVVGAGKTTTEQIKDCNRHLETAEVVRVVLNGAEDTPAAYYSYSRAAPQYAARDAHKTPSKSAAMDAPKEVQQSASRRAPAKARKSNPLSRWLRRLSEI